MSRTLLLCGAVVIAAGGTLIALHAKGGPRASETAATDEDAKKRASQVLIVVPGGGLTPQGEPTAWVQERLKKAVELYKSKQEAGQPCCIVTLSGGTPHKPMPVDARSGFHVQEAEAGAKFLIKQMGVAPADVFEEGLSLDTIGNAFMLRTMHTDVGGWRDLVVVTNNFHMLRTEKIFEKVFSLLPEPQGPPYKLTFVTVPDTGVDPQALQSRIAREAGSTENFVNTTKSMNTLGDMHRFLYFAHNAYASKRLTQDRAPVDPKTLSTY